MLVINQYLQLLTLWTLPIDAYLVAIQQELDYTNHILDFKCFFSSVDRLIIIKKTWRRVSCNSQDCDLFFSKSHIFLDLFFYLSIDGLLSLLYIHLARLYLFKILTELKVHFYCIDNNKKKLLIGRERENNCSLPRHREIERGEYIYTKVDISRSVAW